MTTDVRSYKMSNMKSVLRTIFVLICGGVAIFTLFLTMMPMLNRVANSNNDFLTYYKYSFENVFNTEKNTDLNSESFIPPKTSVDMSQANLNNSTLLNIEASNTSITSTTDSIHTEFEKSNSVLGVL